MTSFALVKQEPETQEQPVSELEVFADMLSYMRPAGSKAEKRFIRKFIQPLGAKPDGVGNYWLVIGESKVLWSSHTDTVHRQGGTQRLVVKDGLISAVGSNCLGADCTTGVWLMRQMIIAKVPGVYVFHREEECGARGSNYIAKSRPEILDGIDFAIAFDRKGNNSVITYQLGQRCASEAFVKSIAPMLPGVYESDDGGTFTDTASYMDFIPECTNISVGYLNQHTAKETQDIRHLMALAKAMIAFDETQLVKARDPKVIDFVYESSLGTHSMNSNRVYGGMTDEEWARAVHGYERDYDIHDKTLAVDVQVARGRAGRWAEADPRSLAIYDIVRDYPAELADWLEQMGYDGESLMHELGSQLVRQ